MSSINDPAVLFQGTTLEGPEIDRVTRTLGDLTDVFSDKDALAAMAADQKVYDVACYFPVADGTTAGLFFGITYIYPGKVGTEYFMTRGHFHQLRDRGEFYHCLEGEGMLILMDEDRQTRAEKMYPGSLHYIPGHTAHRTANTGNSMLVFSAFWPSDAGHDYQSISEKGFSGILVEQNGEPVLASK
ncbi:glucose-6-phosphate isomerase family protein [Flavihumibacter petaseus]|uniref:glucose-6-phosphate isomerase n=1 Tax=Flavihumibacter petaseus NBRC 106054 TaxID=1220578 RepID=A0A0E9N143_9BACT|nr:glucose-6-phosphate isomerase family protein [Flavihumibacter petaseus]GAO43361.1 glucose-6-phosphate isomerase [Flavihumibacter petaseus NBRC 106054]